MRVALLFKLVYGARMLDKIATQKTKCLLLEAHVFQTTTAKVLTVEMSIVKFTSILNTRELTN